MKAARGRVANYSSLGKDRCMGEAKIAASQLLNAIQLMGKPSKLTDVHIVLYFDEVHTLTKSMGPRTGYDVLCSAFSILVDFPFFGIMLSTNCHLAKPASAKKVHLSQRVIEAPLQAPFTELPFDVLENDETIFCLGKTRVEDVSTLAFMVKFGRPL